MPQDFNKAGRAGGGPGVSGWGGTIFHPHSDPMGGGRKGEWSVSLQPNNPIFGGKDWSYYDYTNKDAPWVGLEGPASKLGQKGPKTPDGRDTYYIDSKQSNPPKGVSKQAWEKAYNTPGLMVHGTYNKAGNLTSMSPPGEAGGRGGGGGQAPVGEGRTGGGRGGGEGWGGPWGTGAFQGGVPDRSGANMPNFVSADTGGGGDRFGNAWRSGGGEDFNVTTAGGGPMAYDYFGNPSDTYGPYTGAGGQPNRPGAGAPDFSQTLAQLTGNTSGQIAGDVTGASLPSGNTPGQTLQSLTGDYGVQYPSVPGGGGKGGGGTGAGGADPRDWDAAFGGEGRKGAGQGKTITSGPFKGWNTEQFNAWHGGESAISGHGYPTFSGSTAGPGGTPLTYSTTSTEIPGYGWVPHAQLANPQASLNPLDYFIGKSGTGAPTRNILGTVIGTAAQALVPIPGFGLVAGNLAKMGIGWLQRHGIKPVAPAQAGAVKPAAPAGRPLAPEGYYSNAYLKSIGYHPGEGTGSMFPGGERIGARDIGYYGAGSGTGETGGGFFGSINRSGHPFEALPGSFAGLGQGSGGTLTSGNYDLMANLSNRAMAAGRDPSLGIGRGSAIDKFGQFMVSKSGAYRTSPEGGTYLKSAGTNASATLAPYLRPNTGATPAGQAAPAYRAPSLPNFLTA